jgi:hypothetical protein
VNVNDLLAVTGSWGCSPCGSGFDGPSGSPPSLEYVIGVVLDSSASPATQADIIEQLLANYP